MAKRNLAHGSVDLGDQWVDHSTFHFVAPSASDLKTPLLAGSGAAAFQPPITVTLTAGPLPEDVSLGKLIEEQKRAFAEEMEGFRVRSDESWRHPTLGEILALDFAYQPVEGLIVRQVQLYFPWKSVAAFSCLALSAEERAYDAQREQFDAIFRSFELPTLGR